MVAGGYGGRERRIVGASPPSRRFHVKPQDPRAFTLPKVLARFHVKHRKCRCGRTALNETGGCARTGFPALSWRPALAYHARLAFRGASHREAVASPLKS